MIYAYVSSVIDDYDSTEQQINIIEKYCKANGICVDKYYADRERSHFRKVSEKERAEKLGLSASRHLYTYPELENMFVDIQEQVSDCVIILVDTRVRLYGNSKTQRIEFERIIEEKNIEIVEVGVHGIGEEHGICLYHYTNESKQRPRILLKNLDELYKYASDNSLNVTGVMVDLSLYRRKYYEVLIERVEKKNYTGILVRYAYLLTRKTTQFLKIVNKVGTVYSIAEGLFTATDIVSYKNMPLKVVAVYHSVCLLFGERMKYYCDNYTNWILMGEAESQEFFESRNKDSVDMIIVESNYYIEYDIYRYIRKISRLGDTVLICNLREGSVLRYDRASSFLCESIDNE